MTSLKQLSSRELHSTRRSFVHFLYEYVFNYGSNAEHININKEEKWKAGKEGGERSDFHLSPLAAALTPHHSREDTELCVDVRAYLSAPSS